MPSLLDLPRELRDIILDLVVSTPAVARPDLRNRYFTTAPDRTELDDLIYVSWTDSTNVRYAPRSPCTNSLPLLLVNRQLHAETLDALHRLPTRHSYELDVVIVDEEALYPTWISVPALSTRVDRVYTTIRMLGTSKTSIDRNAFCIGDNARLPPPMAGYFYSLLERFLACGPVGPRKDVPLLGLHRLDQDVFDADADISIKALDLDVLTPTHVSRHLLAPPQTQIWELIRLRRDTGVEFMLHPEYLVAFLWSLIEALLNMDLDMAPYGRLFYERVGTIRLLLDGEVQEAWDLGERLTWIQVDFLRALGWCRDWKGRAYRMRRRLGLTVVPFSHGQ